MLQAYWDPTRSQCVIPVPLARMGSEVPVRRSFLAVLWILPALAAPGGKLKHVRGTVRAVNAEQGWYALVPDQNPGTRYAPEPPLPEAFQKDGLRVVFSGKLGKLPEGGRRWGTPLLVTRIEAERKRVP